MRLISEDKKHDIPYDKYILSYEKITFPSDRWIVVAIPASGVGAHLYMATCKSLEEAKATIMKPALMLQTWVMASAYTTCPEPQVFMFGMDDILQSNKKENDAAVAE